MTRKPGQLVLDVSACSEATRVEFRKLWPRLIAGGCSVTETGDRIVIVGRESTIEFLLHYCYGRGILVTSLPDGDGEAK